MVFVKAAATDEIKPGEMQAFNIEGKAIMLANYRGSYYALDNRCPHMGGQLSKGRLEGKIVICPRHKSQYDITNGRCIAGPRIGFLKLKAKDTESYKTRLEGSSIEVEI